MLNSETSCPKDQKARVEADVDEEERRDLCDQAAGHRTVSIWPPATVPRDDMGRLVCKTYVRGDIIKAFQRLVSVRCPFMTRNQEFGAWGIPSDVAFANTGGLEEL